ncbi:hypothetical protein GV827_21275 [Sulfitobacter sp. JBTF-M27]|uniref:Uncharacterized protein n=1 Tax=Sulfitobacter sediminilitoris TaxID=2698830 RepID=A0A6P0CIH0_9RHOB|nr:hypothetical protein [Sulfitobacter sediminilitoris]NEK24906.1 hypothetical protein [Sulfitobacter sediminilitoris]
MWFDDHLLRGGAMRPFDIEDLVSFWTSKGLKPMKSGKGKKFWNELCVVEAMSNVPTLPCDWIEVSEDGTHAWLKGSPPGAIVVPNYYLDLSRFDAAPLIAFIAAKETNYGNETDGRIPR